jgi:DNA primase
LQKAGLTTEEKAIDRFKGRMIFPIHNYSGKVLGFGGRILKNEAKAAKYINSPETEIYEKRKVLYGIYFSKKAIILKDNCYIVEGYTDVISLHQIGVENVVSSSGTALTVDQIRLVKRITKNITILFDGDAAGIKASFKGIDLILQEDMNVKIVLFPDGQDPDSYARSVDPDEFKQFITENARDFISFKTGLLMDEADNDPVKKTALVREIVQTIAVIPDAISRSVYIQECSKLLGISEQLLINELNKLRKRNASKQRNADAGYDEVAPLDYIKGHPSEVGGARQEPIAGNAEPQERDVIRYLLSYGLEKIVFPEEKSDPSHPSAGSGSSSGQEEDADGDLKEEQEVEEIEIEVAKFIVEEIANDDLNFDHPLYNTVFTEYKKLVKKNKTPSQEFFLQYEDRKVASLAVDLIFSPHELSENWEQRHKIVVRSEAQALKNAVERTVYSFKMAKVKQMLLEKREALKELEDGKTRDDLLQEHYNLEEAKKLISKYLGRVLSPN